ncbi:MAG TPA: WD40 repeat domain-containing serine/threonine-protein kinase, partial [Pirellulales bacterium]|nr:WD40 repeat domain-containing serine/threonine-protein kinase [Pirellulales bacterium]
VLLGERTLKLADFGIGGVVARQSAQVSRIGTVMANQLSLQDQVSLYRGAGTPLYMSREQRDGAAPDPRHDLYSLGVMWYQLLVGDVTRELHPGWPDELLEEFQAPEGQIQLIQRCVGYFKKRPVHAGELLPLLGPARPMLLPAAPAVAGSLAAQGSQPTSRQEERRRQAEIEKLQHALAEQIDRDDLHEARRTSAALLALRPDDTETREARAFIDARLSVPMRELQCFTGHSGWVRSVAAAADGRFALSGSDDKIVRLWDLENRCELRRLSGHTAAVMSVAFSPDGRRAVSGSWDGTVRVWDVIKAKEFRRFEGDWHAVKSVAFAPNGRLALAGTDDNVAHLWDLDNGRELARFEGHGDLVQCLVFAPGGAVAVSGSDDSTLRFWDVETGREIGKLQGHTDAVTSVAFAPDGRRVLSGSSDKTARLWDPESVREIRCFDGHSNWVNSVAFGPGGTTVLTGSGGDISDGQFHEGDDKTVRLWDLESGHELCRFEGHQGPVTSVAYVPGTRHVVSGSLDGTVRLLQIPG